MPEGKIVGSDPAWRNYTKLPELAAQEVRYGHAGFAASATNIGFQRRFQPSEATVSRHPNWEPGLF